MQMEVQRRPGLHESMSSEEEFLKLREKLKNEKHDTKTSTDDKFGGPSKPVIAVQQNPAQHTLAKIIQRTPLNILKSRVEKRKFSRDYSFLQSDDSDINISGSVKEKQTVLAPNSAKSVTSVHGKKSLASPVRKKIARSENGTSSSKFQPSKQIRTEDTNPEGPKGKLLRRDVGDEKAACAINQVRKIFGARIARKEDEIKRLLIEEEAECERIRKKHKLIRN